MITLQPAVPINTFLFITPPPLISLTVLMISLFSDVALVWVATLNADGTF